MKFVCLTLILLSGLAAPPAPAHRLDEYLQATTIAVDNHRVVVRMSMTPGVAVARGVLAAIDTNADGRLSDQEQVAYGERVRRDLSLAIDGQQLPLRLTSRAFTPLDQFQQGMGDIVLEFAADIPAGGSIHQLTLTNHHQNAISVYLVNCLLPNDPNVHVLSQSRNPDQSYYRLDFVDGPALASSSIERHVASGNRLALVTTYFYHGVRHILTGYDHLLFICALVLAATTLWDLIKVVTAFTLAHSITLTFAALSFVHLSGRIVEPMIAASIVFVALQNVLWPQHSRGRSRLIAAFLFGLFHGLGFAGGLLEVMHQMPRGSVLLAIFGFSAGVETGNQLVLIPLFCLLKALRPAQPGDATRAHRSIALRRMGSVGISLAGVYYLCTALSESL